MQQKRHCSKVVLTIYTAALLKMLKAKLTFFSLYYTKKLRLIDGKDMD